MIGPENGPEDESSPQDSDPFIDTLSNVFLSNMEYECLEGIPSLERMVCKTWRGLEKTPFGFADWCADIHEDFRIYPFELGPAYGGPPLLADPALKVYGPVDDPRVIEVRTIAVFKAMNWYFDRGTLNKHSLKDFCDQLDETLMWITTPTFFSHFPHAKVYIIGVANHHDLFKEAKLAMAWPEPPNAYVDEDDAYRYAAQHCGNLDKYVWPKDKEGRPGPVFLWTSFEGPVHRPSFHPPVVIPPPEADA